MVVNETEFVNNSTAIRPSWKSITVDNKGFARIKFSEAMNIPNITNMDSTVLDVVLIPSSNSRSGDFLKFTWNVTAFDRNELTIYLNFSFPLHISANGKDYFDQISVVCKNNAFFVSNKTLAAIVPETYLIGLVPP